MRPPLLVAAGLVVLVAAAHSYLGERHILIRLFRRDDLPKLFGDADFTKQTLRFAWHITSIAWLGLAYMLVVLASSSNAEDWRHAYIIAAVFALSGIVALVGSRGRHLSWLVFFAIARLIWIGYH